MTLGCRKLVLSCFFSLVRSAIDHLSPVFISFYLCFLCFFFSSNSNFHSCSLLLFLPHILFFFLFLTYQLAFPLPEEHPLFVYQRRPFSFLCLSLSLLSVHFRVPLKYIHRRYKYPHSLFLQAESLGLTCPLREEPSTLHRPRGDPYNCFGYHLYHSLFVFGRLFLCSHNMYMNRLSIRCSREGTETIKEGPSTRQRPRSYRHQHSLFILRSSPLSATST
jgi:hypothetical protein